MATVSELVTYQLAQTEKDLQSDDGLNEFATIKASHVARAKAEFYGSAVPTETEMHEVIKYFLSDVAALYLIDTAIDWYQSKTVRSAKDDADTLVFYDRVQALRATQQRLTQRVRDTTDRVRSLAFGSDNIGDMASLPLAQAQADSAVKVTRDPWQVAKMLYGDLVQIDEGIAPKVQQVQRP